MMSTMMDMSSDPNVMGLYNEPRYKETQQEKEAKRQASKIKQNLSKGLKLFEYGSFEIWAINQKVADRKAEKLNLI